MSSNQSAPGASEDIEASPPPTGTRYSIFVEADGTIGGKDADKWSSRCGVLIRSFIPISYTDWRLIDDSYMNDFWEAVMNEFEMNLKPEVARAAIDKDLSQFFRTFKCTLRKKIIRVVANKREAIAACPNDIDKIHWEKFVDNEFEEKKIQQCKTNSANRGKNSINHCLGRKSYTKVYKELEKKTPGVQPKRTDAWKAARTRKNGEVLPSALEKYNEIEAVEQKRKAADTSGNSSSTNTYDFSHDELVEVFGPDKKHRCLAIGSNSSKKKVMRSIAARTIVEQKCTMKDGELRATVVEVVKDIMKDVVTEIKGMLFGMQNRAIAPLNGGTPRTEAASNTMESLSTPKNLTHPFGIGTTPEPHINHIGTSNSGRQNVMLLSGDQKEVAKGYLATHTGVCHMRQVAIDERKVWVMEVLEPEATIYEAPQNGHSKLFEFVDGGFLIWPESRLRYI